MRRLPRYITKTSSETLLVLREKQCSYDRRIYSIVLRCMLIRIDEYPRATTYRNNLFIAYNVSLAAHKHMGKYMLCLHLYGGTVNIKVIGEEDFHIEMTAADFIERCGF